MGSNSLATLMHRMTVSSKDKSKNNDKMTSGAAKKSATVVKRGERQAVAGAHTNLRSQSRKRPSGGEEELHLSEEDELVMEGAEYDQRNAAALQENGSAQQPKRRRSKVTFHAAVEIPKLEDEERKDSAVDVAIKRKFSMHDFCGTLKVMTGPNQFMFDYPRTLLVRNSDFFRKATEIEEFDPRLPFDFTDIDPSIFTIWLVWLASNNIENAKECIVVPDGLDKAELQGQSFLKRLQLIHCYVLGERLVDRSFKNYVMDTLITHCKFVFDTFGPVDGLGNGARLVYEKTKSTSLLRRLVLENYFATGSFADCKSRAPGDKCDGNCAVTEQFYLDLAKIGMRVAREQRSAPLPPWEQQYCYYHDHSDQVEGYICNKERL